MFCLQTDERQINPELVRDEDERFGSEIKICVSEQKKLRKVYWPTKKLVGKLVIDEHKQCCIHEQELLMKADIRQNTMKTFVEGETPITEDVLGTCATMAYKNADQNAQVI